jgi:metallo-beta-lactamase class B
MTRFLLALLVACRESPPPPKSSNAMIHGEWSAAVEPFNVVGNIYYVGAKNVASYLIATSDGLILLDTGTKEMVPVVTNNIAKLGFAVKDIKLILSNHAHYDHVGGHAAMKRATGARVLVMAEDAPAVESGVDMSPLGDEGWQPVIVDGKLHDGETVTLGDASLVAILAPGHTPGCTVWTTNAREQAKTYAVVFYGCARPNDSVQLIGNSRFPNLVEQTRATFRRMRTLAPDIFVTMHPESLFEGKVDQMRAKTRPHPLEDPRAWPKLLDEHEADFAERLKQAEQR